MDLTPNARPAIPCMEGHGLFFRFSLVGPAWHCRMWIEGVPFLSATAGFWIERTLRTSKMSNASEDVSSISLRKSSTENFLFVYKVLDHATICHIEEKQSSGEEYPASWTRSPRSEKDPEA